LIIDWKILKALSLSRLFLYLPHHGPIMFSDITRLTESHQQLRQLTQRLHHCHNHDVSASYAQLLDWTEKVFATEQRLMETHAFPVTQCHLEQHARVLCAMHRAHAAVMAGDYAQGQHVGSTLLPAWFELHNATLDAALLLWASSRASPRPESAHHTTLWVAPELGQLESRSKRLELRHRERRSPPHV